MGFKTITEPTTEPISIAKCRAHLHWDIDSDFASESDIDETEDALILDKLGAAREYAESVTGLYLSPRTVEKTFDRFPHCRSLELDGGPVRSIESVEYIASDGTPTELGTGVYSLNDYVEPARLDLNFEQSWPPMRCGPNALKVRYVVGYGTVNHTPPETLALPKDIEGALLLTMAHLLENKEDSAPIALEAIPTGTRALLQGKRANLGV